MRVGVWVASFEPAAGVFTAARTCQGRLRRHCVILRDRLRRPLTEPACRQVRQLSGSGEQPDPEAVAEVARRFGMSGLPGDAGRPWRPGNSTAGVVGGT